MAHDQSDASDRRHVRRASANEAGTLARLLTAAFMDDAIEHWCLACDDLPTLLELQYLSLVSQLAAKGWLWVVDDLSGVAAWIPPGFDYDADAIDATVNPALVEHGGHAGRLARFWEWVDDHRPAEPHWYVDLVAADPDRREVGIGHLLLSHGLLRVDALGDPSFLVTGNARTVQWYEQHGFAVVTDEDAPDGGPHVWFMLRPPGG